MFRPDMPSVLWKAKAGIIFPEAPNRNLVVRFRWWGSWHFRLLLRMSEGNIELITLGDANNLRGAAKRSNQSETTATTLSRPKISQLIASWREIIPSIRSRV
jgi:hypothetical protein